MAGELGFKGSKLKRLASYGIGDFGLNIYWNTLSLYLVYWYTVIVGLPPQTAGTLYLIGMVWDAFSDPVVASLSERVRSRFGTYRPFILFGSGLAAFSFVALFWVPPFEGATLLVVLVLCSILFRTAYTLVAIPYSALSARLTYDSVERTELSGVRMFFAFGGLLIVSNVLPPLVRHFSGGETYTASGFQSVVAIGSVVATGALLLCFAGTREQPLPARSEAVRLVPADLARTLFSNRALLILLVVILFQSGANASLMISLVFFIEANQPAFASKETVLTCFAISILCGVPFWTLFIRAIGKKKAWIAAAVAFAGFGAHMLVFDPYLVRGVPVQVMGFGFAQGAFAVLIWSFVPDTVEYGQMRSGYRAEGVAFGSVLIVQKLSGGAMGFIFGHVLGAIGYAPGLESTPGAGRDLVVFLAICPPALLLASIIPILAVPLDRRIHADIVGRLSDDGPAQEREPSWSK